MKYLYILIFLFISNTFLAQTKNYIDMPFVETSATIDTLVTPDRIYLTIFISEKDTRGRTSVEDLENKMATTLTGLGIDISKQLSVYDLSSNFRKYFLKQQDVLKTKSYSLLVYDAQTAGRVIVALENDNISNIHLEKTEYSKMGELKIALRTQAILKAKDQANAMVEPLNQKVGNAIFISDIQIDSDSYAVNRNLQGRAGGIIVRGIGKVKERGYNPGPFEIEFQKIEVEGTVHVRFKIE